MESLKTDIPKVTKREKIISHPKNERREKSRETGRTKRREERASNYRERIEKQ